MKISVVSLVVAVLLTAALTMWVLATLAFLRRRRAPECTLLAVLTAAVGFYCFGEALADAQTTLQSANFWIQFDYIGIPWIPTLWLVLVRRRFGLPTPTRLLYIVSAVYALAEFTNGLHHLHDRSIWLIHSGPFCLLEFDRGPVALLFIAYIYGVQIYTAALCIAKFCAASGRQRRQIAFFAVSGLPPCAGFTVYLLGLSPWGLDLGPIALCLTVLIGYVTVFRQEAFNVIPSARSLVFTSIRDAVLVTDPWRRLVDFNPAAGALFPSLQGNALGRDLASAVPECGALFSTGWKPNTTQQMPLEFCGMTQRYEVAFFPLEVKHQQAGWAIIFANITSQVKLVEELQRSAETDALTRVANRRAFDLAMHRECARAVRYGTEFALLLLDIDHFKTINDACGHSFGDRALLSVVECIRACLRSSDLLGRYGGDEFAVLLPETTLTDAAEVAERIRREVERSANSDAGQPRVTISIGLSGFVRGTAADPQFLYEQADEALYCAKRNGRNRLSLWPGLTLLSSPPIKQSGAKR